MKLLILLEPLPAVDHETVTSVRIPKSAPVTSVKSWCKKRARFLVQIHRYQ